MSRKTRQHAQKLELIDAAYKMAIFTVFKDI